MHNTIHAALRKWCRSPLVWLSLLLSAACGLCAGYFGMAGMPDYSGRGEIPASAAQYFESLPFHMAFAMQILCTAAVTALTAGLECAEGTVRNYLTVGCRRSVFFLSQICAAVLYAAVSAALMLGVFAAFAARVLSILPDHGFLLLVLLFFLISVTAGAVTAAIAVNCTKQVRALFLSVGLCFVLGVSGLIGYYTLREREPYQLYFSGGSSFSLHRTPGYVGGKKRSLLLCLQAMNPAGQYFYCAQYLETRTVYALAAGETELLEAADAYRADLDGSAACIIGFAALISLIGCTTFDRRNLT